MIASATYEDWCALTEGTRDWDTEAAMRAEQEFRSRVTALGGDMLGTQDHDGDERDDEAQFCEDLEDYLSTLDDLDRAVVAGNALASCSDEHALITVSNWLCKVGPEARAIVARESLALVARNLQGGASHRAIVDLFNIVSPSAIGKVLERLPGEAE